MHYNPKFIPQSFLQNIVCQYLPYGNNQTPYVSFAIDNVYSYSYTVENMHGNVVVIANSTPQKADAHIITGTHHDINKLSYRHLAIKTADCLPIVFVYKDSHYFLGGVTHAGWRGLTSQIISNTIEKLAIEGSQLGIPKEIFLQNLNIFVGPAIFGISYECGNDVREALNNHKLVIFKNEDNHLRKLFDECSNLKCDPILVHDIQLMTKKESIFPDLQLLAVLECVNIGVRPNNISIFRENTYGHNELPSFREYSHHPERGRDERLWTHLNLP